MNFKKISTIFIFLLSVSSWSNGSDEGTRMVVNNSQSIIHCPTGDELSVPKGTELELSGFKIGKMQIVKVPQSLSLSNVCAYGILKMNSKNPKKKLKMSAIEKKKLKKIVGIAEKMKYAKSCKESFIGSDGLGPLGKVVKSELASGKYNELLQNSKAFRDICPGFSKMKKEDRKNLWVFLLMSMSHYESSCRTQVEAQGPNGTAKGLFQLHDGAENKYSHWDTNQLCRKGDSKNPKESIQCTLSMLNGQVEKFDSIFFNKSYWDVLRNVDKPATQASKIKSAIKMFAGCESRVIASNSSLNKEKTKKL